ncbi:MAG: hypothetical protein ACKVPY_15970 [Paracoccaceae bacterium]
MPRLIDTDRSSRAALIREGLAFEAGGALWLFGAGPTPRPPLRRLRWIAALLKKRNV